MTAWKTPFVDFPKHYKSMEGEIDAAIKRVLSTGNLIMRQDMLDFEQSMAQFLRAEDAVAVGNCTDGLFLSLLASGVGPGDEVVTVSHTFVATLEAIVHTGAKPVLVDIGEDFLMDPTKLEAAITPRTKAVIPVHLNGRVCDMAAIGAIAKKHKLTIIEDAAQALGGTCDGVKGGAFGAFAGFSFYPAKLLGAFGDAGLVACKSRELGDAIRLRRDHGRVGKDTLALFGYNSRCDNLQAAILNVKLLRVPAWIEQRRTLAAVYDRGLAAVSQIALPPGPVSGGRFFDVYQNYVIKAKRRNELADHLKASGVEVLISNPIPVHHQKALGLAHFKLPVTERVAGEVLSLPLIPEIDPPQVEYVIETIKQFYART